MALLETVRHWNDGVCAFQEGRFQDSLLCFNHILDPSARIQFNLACVLKKLGKETDCILHLSEAIKKDPHLAVAYFHRSVQLLKTKRYDDALIDLEKAEKSFRGSTFITYNQLGLNFTLYRFEIDFNKAVCVAKKGDVRTAIHMLIEAGKIADEEIHNRICVNTIQDLTLFRQDGLKGSLPSSFKEFEIPDDGIFQPPKDMVANLEKKQFVAKAKVVTKTNEPSKEKEKDSKPSFISVATKVSPLPRRPLPPPPTDIKHAKSAENLVSDVKRESSQRRKLSMDHDLLNALNARFRNSDTEITPQLPEKKTDSPSRPPRRPPPPTVGKTYSSSPPAPAKPSRVMPSQQKSPSNSISRNIPPPPSYKPPPPPPTFKPPFPPENNNELPALPPKIRSRQT